MPTNSITPGEESKKFENRPPAPTSFTEPFQPLAEGVLCFWDCAVGWLQAFREPYA